MSQLDQVTSSDLAAVALDLVAESAAAIRQSEEQAAHALLRERDIANEIKKELERAELRAESAETMLRLAETQIEQMLAAGRGGQRDRDPTVRTRRQGHRYSDNRSRDPNAASHNLHYSE